MTTTMSKPIAKKKKPVPNAKRWALFAAAAAGVSVGGVALLHQNTPVAPQVQVWPAEQTTFVKTVTSSGTVKAEVSRTLAFVGTANVAELGVKLGDTVRAGQKLARLDTASMERDLLAARVALQSAENDLARAQASSSETERDLRRQVSNSEAAVSAAQTALADAERNLALQSRLVAAGVASAQDERTARNTRDEAARKLQAAERDLAFNRAKTNSSGTSVLSAQSALQAARVRVQNLAKSLQDAQLYAPVAGVVSAVNITVGTPAPNNQPALEITDPNKLYLEIQFDETRAAALRPGQPAEVKFDALPRKKFSGTVDRVAPVARESGQVAAVLVRVRLHDPEGVKPGFTGTATVITRRIKEAVTVPLEATREASGQVTVWRVQPALAGKQDGEGQLQPVHVEVVDRNANAAAVEGLKKGDLIVTPAPEDLGTAALNTPQKVQYEPLPVGLDGKPMPAAVGGKE